MVKKPYPPGMHGKKRRRQGSEFATELKEKQKLRYTYGLTNSGLGKVFSEAARMPGGVPRRIAPHFAPRQRSPFISMRSP
jgi:ribosomal protein S4